MGLEPVTFRLQIGCSTIELRRPNPPAFKEHTLPDRRESESVPSQNSSRKAFPATNLARVRGVPRAPGPLAEDLVTGCRRGGRDVQ
jgi:hypothetical protein